MPSTIGYTGYNALGGAAANYLKAKPSTRFTTRDLAFCVIDMDNSNYFNNYLDANSNFSKVVRAVQLQAEIFAVGTPASGVVTIVVAIDTVNDGVNIDETPGNPAQVNDMAKTIQTITGADTVTFSKLVGGGFASLDITKWTTDGSTVV